MTYIKLYLFYITMLGCGVANDKTITVIGTAEDAKGGAIVISKTDSVMYYVADIAYWDQQIIGKQVKVTGRLQVENFEPQKPEEEISQQITGIKRTILKPKWELIK